MSLFTGLSTGIRVVRGCAIAWESMVRVTSAGVEDRAPQDRAPQERLGRDLAIYTAARVGVFVVLAGLFVLVGVPLVVSLAVAIVIALPLSIVAFRGLNQRVTAGLAARGEARRVERARLRAQLRGDSRGDSPGDSADGS